VIESSASTNACALQTIHIHTYGPTYRETYACSTMSCHLVLRQKGQSSAVIKDSLLIYRNELYHCAAKEHPPNAFGPAS